MFPRFSKFAEISHDYQSTSPLAQTVRSIAASPYIAAMSALARFMARALTVLVESRRASGWESIGRTLQRLQTLTAAVEKDWERCPLAQVSKEEELSGRLLCPKKRAQHKLTGLYPR